MKLNFAFVVALVLFLVTTFNRVAFAQSQNNTITPSSNAQEIEKTNNIKKLLEIAGTKVFLQRIITQLLNDYKFKNPQDSQKFLDYFAAEIKTDDMLDKTIPLYKKYFTNEEIKQLIAFYETPVAQKLITVIPQISQESLTIVISSARAAAERALKKLEAEGYIRPSK